jgi:hypothetical protein
MYSIINATKEFDMVEGPHGTRGGAALYVKGQ